MHGGSISRRNQIISYSQHKYHTKQLKIDTCITYTFIDMLLPLHGYNMVSSIDTANGDFDNSKSIISASWIKYNWAVVRVKHRTCQVTYTCIDNSFMSIHLFMMYCYSNVIVQVYMYMYKLCVLIECLENYVQQCQSVRVITLQ